MKSTTCSKITIVDINYDAINQAKKTFLNDDTVSCHAADLKIWIENDDTSYGGVIGIWVLSYLDGPSVNKFLRWAKIHCKFMLLVEPVYEGNKEFEKY